MHTESPSAIGLCVHRRKVMIYFRCNLYLDETIFILDLCRSILQFM